MLRFRLYRHSEYLFEVVERCFDLAIGVDHVSQFLKETKNKKRIDKEREKLSDGNAVRIDEIQHQKQDRGPQKIYDAALHKTEAAKVANLFKFQFENLIRGGVEAIDFLLRETETLYQFDVSQRFRRCAGKRCRLIHNAFLNGLDSAAQQRTQAAEKRDRQQIGRSDRPMHFGRINGHEHQANYRREDHVYKQRYELLVVASNSLQLSERFSAALILEPGVR